jgi:DNA-binding transcriptional LysR family regulator
MRSLNLDQLRALVAVTEGRSFSAAARRLNLSQPAVSMQIRELERRYGVTLVERLGKQAHATPPGRELIEAAHRILRECDEADAAMRRYRQGWIGRVRIATTNTGLMYLLPPVLRWLSQTHPGIDLHVTNLPTRESVESILRNTADLAIVTLPVETAQLRITPLRRERMVAIFPSGATGVPDIVTPEVVQRTPLVLEHTRAALHDIVMGWLGGLRPQPRVRMHLGTIEALKIAVGSHLGMSIVPAMALGGHETDIIARPLRPRLERTLALIEHRSKPSETALDTVRTALLGLRETASGDDGSVGKRPRFLLASRAKRRT